MAVRSEDLIWQEHAIVYRFPTAAVRRRARRQMMRRRRATLGFLALVVAATLAGGGVAETAPRSRTAPAGVTVRPGDTLWGIAERYA
nr:LysM peptidoglycan-binding domain-containing protein [Actinomycetota bacterium]